MGSLLGEIRVVVVLVASEGQGTVWSCSGHRFWSREWASIDFAEICLVAVKGADADDDDNIADSTDGKEAHSPFELLFVQALLVVVLLLFLSTISSMLLLEFEEAVFSHRFFLSDASMTM